VSCWSTSLVGGTSESRFLFLPNVSNNCIQEIRKNLFPDGRGRDVHGPTSIRGDDTGVDPRAVDYGL
jgi:hypothetical protein